MKYLSRFLQLVLACFSLAVCMHYARADDSPSGTPFFLLSDASYGSNDNPTVRIEAQNLATVQEFGGVDIYVYKLKQPLDFLRKQKNLHRIDTTGDYVGEGLSNTLAHIWDDWWAQSRTTWRKLFSNNARQAVTSQAPETRSHPLSNAATPETRNPQYRPIKGYNMVDSFRYPVHIAKPIAPPKGVKLEGSSSDFLQSPAGNVLVPLGKREPGLYLVEAMVGEHRASTLVFVSDTIAVTKVSAHQMTVWAAQRETGDAVSDVNTVWTDGVGSLASGKSDRNGLVSFDREVPERSYVFGEDAKGGVFISENFYYDSEIYNAKLYAVTDRPLYRAGEQVSIKIFGRDFRSARDSSAVAEADIKLQVFDPNGFPVANQTLHMTPGAGGDTSVRLPDNAAAGGYEIRFAYKDGVYSAAFRVSEYQKPHFEIAILPAKKEFKTHEAVTGRLQLSYPDGKPVANAHAELSVRAQRMTMVDGDLGYAGQFPVQLTNSDLTTDSNGVVSFTIPAADDPSRYVLSVLATDGAAYRVRANKELLIERGTDTFALKAERDFSAVDEEVGFTLRSVIREARVEGASKPAWPARWQWTRLEDRETDHGNLPGGDKFTLRFKRPGTYTVNLYDDRGNIVAATTHYVSGSGVVAPQGAIDMVFDKTSYRPGETAHALITFPQKVDQALLTLERDRVEQSALMASATGWVKARRVTDYQWQLDLPVQATYSPNITLSVAFVKHGEYAFQNLGLKVEQPRIEVAVTPGKPSYQPGETVDMDLYATVDGKPVPNAVLTVGVVDEMIYVLQPEIAPDMFDFFYHPRRNNVRTSSSLNFIAYDLAKPPTGPAMPSRRQTHERAIKLLERPRRDDKDTAYWAPTLKVDASGHAHVRFKMPDALTRWRVTVRAMSDNGTVGQSTSYVKSDKDFFVKWTSPNWLRKDDQPNASVAIFNQGQTEVHAELQAVGLGLDRKDKINLKPGVNFAHLPLSGQRGEGLLRLALSVEGKPVDAFDVPIRVESTQWRGQHSVSVPVSARETALALPADASNVRVQFMDGASAEFHRIMDDLMEYPYGCVEQTSSRLLPYSLALKSATDETVRAELTQRLHSYRFRLAQMAGPDAVFGWWSVPGDKDSDALLTAYAYYADWYASDALQLTLPEGHFDRLLNVYRTNGVKRSHWHRALMLSWMQDMGLPVRSMAEALAGELGEANTAATSATAKTKARNAMNSVILMEADDDLQNALAQILTAQVVRKAQGALPATLNAKLDKASELVRDAGLPVGRALLLNTGRLSLVESTAVLDDVRAEYPTIDRSMSLLWTYQALNGGSARSVSSKLLTSSLAKLTPEKAWVATATRSAMPMYRWSDREHLPKQLVLAEPPKNGVNALVQYESAEPEQSNLAVKVERTLYRLVRVQSEASKPAQGQAATPNTNVGNADGVVFKMEVVAAGTAMKTDELYLDQITLTPAASNKSALHYGIVEVALPPGATPDRTTWGIQIRGFGKTDVEPLERASFELAPHGYSVPVDVLNGVQVIRHLVRVSQTGHYVLPPARYYQMYAPDQKALQAGKSMVLEVR